MTEPMPAPVALPQTVLRRIRSGELRPAPEFPHRLGESPDEARERVQRAAEAAVRARLDLWEAMVPSRFAGATVDTLTAAQHPERLASWWESDALTLILRSDESGVGKTHAAYAVANTVVAREQVLGACYTMIGLNEAFRPGNDPTAYATAQTADLLLVDDLGREQISPWTLERLQGVLDARWSNERKTIITTQVPGDQMVARYGDPIVDRLRDDSWTLPIVGGSRRKPAPW